MRQVVFVPFRIVFACLLMLMIPGYVMADNEGFLGGFFYQIECKTVVYNENLDEIDSYDNDILKIYEEYGNLDVLNIESEGLESHFKLRMDYFKDYRHDVLDNDEGWNAWNGNMLVGYSEFLKIPRIIYSMKTPRRHYCHWIKRIYSVSGIKNKRYRPVEIEDFKEHFLRILKNEDEDE